MKTAARIVFALLLAILIVGQAVSLGMQEGFDMVALMFGFVALVLVTFCYGFLTD